MTNDSSTWLIPCNLSLYDPYEAFENLRIIDWRQSSNVNAGDCVYIYCGKPDKRIAFKTIVIESHICPEKADKSDLKYHKNGTELIGKTPRFGYMRLKLVGTSDNEKMALQALMRNGLASAPQGPLRLKEKLLNYIENNF